MIKKLFTPIIFVLIFSFWLVFRSKELPIISPLSDISLPKIISQIFPKTEIDNPLVTIGLVGDLGLGRYITYVARNKNDFSWSFSGVSDLLQQNDFNLANLESPIISNCPTGPLDTMIFCGDPQFVPELSKNKFILNLANNHIFNYGQNGFTQTKDLLNQPNIGYFNSQKSDTEFYQKEINGIKFGFLGFDLITYPRYDHQKILDLISKYDSQVDWLIVSIHWGNEYLPAVENWRVTLAHQMVDAGADLIHGHHPHVLQESESYQNKLIFYSLGNFIFDQNWSVPTSTSEIVILTLDKNKIIDQKTIPLQIKNNSRPEVVIN